MLPWWQRDGKKGLLAVYFRGRATGWWIGLRGEENTIKNNFYIPPPTTKWRTVQTAEMETGCTTGAGVGGGGRGCREWRVAPALFWSCCLGEVERPSGALCTGREGPVPMSRLESHLGEPSAGLRSPGEGERVEHKGRPALQLSFLVQEPAKVQKQNHGVWRGRRMPRGFGAKRRNGFKELLCQALPSEWMSSG